MSRRIPALVVVLVAVVALAVVWRAPIVTQPAVFTEVARAWMPSATLASDRPGTWICPGVPATGEPGIGGEIIISNVGPDPVTARIQWVLPVSAADAGSAENERPGPELVVVDPYAVTRVDVGARHRGLFVGAVVAVERSDVIVEQQAFHPAGNPISPCADTGSDQWHLAEGFTLGGSVNRVLITNPSEDLAIVDITFATAEGARVPAAYQGIPIPARSLRVLDLGVEGGGAQEESRLAISVRATRGQVVVGRAQHQLDGGRLGYTLSLGAPSARDQWWFAGGLKGPEVTERFMVYNPTTEPVEVDVVFLGVGDLTPLAPLQVPARNVVAFDTGPLSTLSEGRHAAVFSTDAGDAIVVERIVTTVSGARPSTSVLLGAPPRHDGYVASVWRAGVTPSEPTTEAFVIYNVDNSPGLIDLEYLSDQGLVPVPGGTGIEIGAAEILTVDLTEPRALGAEVIITSTTRVVVERNFPSGFESGRSASWALPVR